MNLDELEKLAAHIVARTGDTEVAVIPYLVQRLRATEALVESAYRDGCSEGSTTPTDWADTDAKAALDRLREGA